MTTPILGLPYPDPADPAANGADDIRALAEAVDGQVGGALVSASRLGVILPGTGSQFGLIMYGWAEPPRVTATLQIQWNWFLKLSGISEGAAYFFCNPEGGGALPDSTVVPVHVFAHGRALPGQVPSFAPTTAALDDEQVAALLAGAPPVLPASAEPGR